MNNMGRPSIQLVLIKLYTKGPMNNKKLSHELRISEYNISTLLSEMEGCKLIEKKKAEYSDREKINYLTPMGEVHAIAAVIQVGLSNISSAMKETIRLPTDQDEKDFVDILKKSGPELTKIYQTLQRKRGKQNEE